MGRLEQEIGLTPNEQGLFEFQRKTVEKWSVPQDIFDKAHDVIENRRSEVGEGYFALARKTKKHVESLHFVGWEERVRNGEIYGELGKVKVSEDGEHIECHLCGGWFVALTITHLYAHGLEDGDAYRELMGLNQSQPLCSPSFSNKRRQLAEELSSADYFEGKSKPFARGYDPRSQRGRRLQYLLEREELDRKKRLEGVMRRNSKGGRPGIRNLDGGSFQVFGRDYYFSTKADDNYVEIIPSKDKVIARGFIGGELVEKIYERRDI